MPCVCPCLPKQAVKLDKLADKLRTAEVSAKPGARGGMLSAVR